MSDTHVHERQVMETRFGTLITALNLPSPEGETFEHKLDGFCWCQPLVETQLDGSHLFIHRRSLDDPHLERVS